MIPQSPSKSLWGNAVQSEHAEVVWVVLLQVEWCQPLYSTVLILLSKALQLVLLTCRALAPWVLPRYYKPLCRIVSKFFCLIYTHTYVYISPMSELTPLLPLTSHLQIHFTQAVLQLYSVAMLQQTYGVPANSPPSLPTGFQPLPTVLCALPWRQQGLIKAKYAGIELITRKSLSIIIYLENLIWKDFQSSINMFTCKRFLP